MKNINYAKRMFKIDVLCSLLWMLNVVIRLFKHPDDTFGIVIWAIGALLFGIGAYYNYKAYHNMEEKGM